MLKDKLFKEGDPRTMAELRYRVRVMASIYIIFCFVFLVAMKLIISFWPVVLVLAITVMLIRFLIRTYKKKRQN